MSSWEPLLERVVRERYPRLVTHAMLVSGSAADAQDLVQEALIATFSGRARFRSVEQAEAYVRRAIASRSVDASRRRATESRTSQRLAGLAVPTLAVEERGPGADVLRALSTLSPRERACVVLRQLDDLSVADTAAQLGLSEGAVKRYTADGIARLNAVLGSTAVTVERISVRQVETVEVRDGQ
ncbi:RNA polymerase sigma factor [Cellulomonas chitinilytica]|uniref:RNA polymerase sigma factor n=1 Tax=Cellulomonas chitinilytica TaxID=398759 RepID=A0A919P095_9CELL|nr:sigma-70 family RNA polymerase sigma factor [Cellulomonas chitinilytica]GIG19742.1 RNA polymerase sigma factor [Cellulomonas chitinilytica]